MSDRDWSKELAKVDRHLDRAGDEALFPEPRNATPAQRAAVAEKRGRTSTAGVVARLALALTLGVAMLFWPYEVRCGVGLAGYLVAVAVLLVSGVWTAVWSWRHHSARAHLLSLVLVAWATVLGAREVLPRTGYAVPDPAHPALWSCDSR